MKDSHQELVKESCKAFAHSLDGALFNFLQTQGTSQPFCQEIKEFPVDQNFYVSILFVGSIYGEFIVGTNREFAEKLVSQSGLIQEGDDSEFIELFKEVTNVAAGESLEALSQHHQKLTITAPRIYQGAMKLPSYNVFCNHLIYGDGEISCYSYIDPMELDLTASYNESLENLSTAYHRISQKSVELKTAENQKSELERLNRAKSEFLANMSHELRTPLNGMIGMLDLFKKSDLSTAQSEQLDIISRSGDFLLAIINDVLEFSKIESGKLEIESREFDLRSCVEELAHIMANEAYRKNLELPIYIDPQIPKYLLGDETRIRQILINLIGNAIKFTPAGEIFLNVVQVPQNQSKEHHLRFEVIDTGVGIPESKVTTIFESFSQADISDTRKYGGSGLGLTICKSIVEAMGGTIQVESSEGEGSNFSFEVPFQAVTSGEIQPMGPVFSVLRNSRVSESVQKYLVDQGIEVENFASFSEMNNVLSERPLPDALIVDGFFYFSGDQDYQQAMQGPIKDVYQLILSDPHQISELREKIESEEKFYGSSIAKPIRRENLLQTLKDKPTYSEESQQASDPSPSEPTSTAPPQATVKKVLLVEDNLINQQVALAMLDLEGISYEVANNGQEGVDLAKSQSFDVILMDCQMPVMDGYKATQEIRAYEAEKGQHTPIVAMTANAFRSTKERCFECGMDDFVTKPIKSDRFMETLMQAGLKKKEAA